LGSEPINRPYDRSTRKSHHFYIHKIQVNLILFRGKPFLKDQLSDKRGNLDWKLLIGSFMFGLGWGIGGLCPGPFLLLIPQSDLRIAVFWGLSFIIGTKLTQLLNSSKVTPSSSSEAGTISSSAG
jgi:uncharacterized membrane protein YedE/YeeE